MSNPAQATYPEICILIEALHATLNAEIADTWVRFESGEISEVQRQELQSAAESRFVESYSELDNIEMIQG